MLQTKTSTLWHVVSVASVIASCLILTQGEAAKPISFSTPFVTRTEAVMILLKTRVQGPLPQISESDRVFPDIEKDSWYERFMILGERYAIVDSDAQKNLRPDQPVLRAEFLTMMARTFGLQENLPYLYQDVDASAWYAKYAGIADRYHLFSADPYQSKLLADSALTHQEVVRALQNFLKQQSIEQMAPLQDRHTASLKAIYNLQTYERMSTQTQNVSLIQAGNGVFTVPSEVAHPAYENPSNIPALREQIRILVNIERQKQGLGTVQENDALQQSAQHYAEDMAAQNFFGHVSPTGQTLQDRIDASGYYRPFYQQACFCTAHFTIGENLARGQRTAQEVMDAWMKSPAHRKTILTPEFQEIGVGIKAGVWVEHFGGHKEER